MDFQENAEDLDDLDNAQEGGTGAFRAGNLQTNSGPRVSTSTASTPLGDSQLTALDNHSNTSSSDLPTVTGPDVSPSRANGNALGDENDSVHEELAPVAPMRKLLLSPARRHHQQEQEQICSEVQLLSWGQNSYSELGLGDTSRRSAPEVVKFLKERNLEAKQVVAGNEHTAILTRSGAVYSVGYNDSGQCGVGHTNRVSSFQEVEALRDKDIVSLCSANGCEHILAITSQGLVYSFGYNSRGQLGHGTTTHVSRPRLVEALATRRVVTISCSYHHTILSTSDDEVFAMGRNDCGQLGVGDTTDRNVPVQLTSLPRGVVLSLAAGQYHSVISIDGLGVFSCGKNDNGQLGMSMTTVESQSLPVHVLAPLGPAAPVRPYTPNAPLVNSHQNANANPLQVIHLSCGYYHTVALTADGAVYTWGRGDHGQLGIGTRTNHPQPQRVQNIPENIISAACGAYHTLLLSENGQVYAFGRNNHHQLGCTENETCASPIRVSTLAKYHVTQIAAGFYHSLCLTGPPDHSSQPPVSTLSFDLRRMINNPARADVTFIVEDRPLYAHRVIIMARCEPFEVMLAGPMREANQREIHLRDQQYHVILALLEFLYTDEVQALTDGVDLNFALDLLAVADQFLVDRLKSLCEIAIQKSISIENVSMMFKTADQRQALSLRRRCFDFILKNFGEVIGTKGFVQLPRNLLADVLASAHERGVTIRPSHGTLF
mmetsp:Transcript_22421/g.44006  ORF Transcript_22421/g.44006 Transcript_22421/m.44006 type:complete len:716 (+) Transcript_22421:238-2385(+)